MNIYLAARYTRRLEVVDYAVDLRALGHTIVSRWLLGNHQIDDAEMMAMEGAEIAAKRTDFALDDYRDIMLADCCISFTEAPRSQHSRGGRHVELGIALARQMRVIVVGHRENVFHCMPQVEFFPSWVQLWTALCDEREAVIR